MNATQLPFVVEAVLILVAMVLGGLLGRKPRPYGKVKVSFHIFFALWFTLGYYFIAQGIFSVRLPLATAVSILVMGIALLVQIVSGVVMLSSTARGKRLPVVHGTSATIVLVADVVAFVLAGLGA